MIEITCRNRSKREHYGYDIARATGRRLSASYITPERRVPPLILMHARFPCNPFLQGVRRWGRELTEMLADVVATWAFASPKILLDQLPPSLFNIVGITYTRDARSDDYLYYRGTYCLDMFVS